MTTVDTAARAERLAKAWGKLKGVEVRLLNFTDGPHWHYDEGGNYGNYRKRVPDPATAEGMVAWMEVLWTAGWAIELWPDERTASLYEARGKGHVENVKGDTLLTAFAAAVSAWASEGERAATPAAGGES